MIATQLNHYLQLTQGIATLIVVTKNQPLEAIQEIYDLNYKIYGENKVQELVAKYEHFPKDVEWHLIGHLQTNKVKYIAPFVHTIQAVDTDSLLQEINKHALKNNRIINCLLQVHIAQEETKFGFSSEELLTYLKTNQWKSYSNVKINGLMGMASFVKDTSQVEREFLHLKNTLDIAREITQLEMPVLSMGMSNDCTIALPCGSNMIRVGSSIFN